jgi:hypothetical protein
MADAANQGAKFGDSRITGMQSSTSAAKCWGR